MVYYSYIIAGTLAMCYLPSTLALAAGAAELAADRKMQKVGLHETYLWVSTVFVLKMIPPIAHPNPLMIASLMFHD